MCLCTVYVSGRDSIKLDTGVLLGGIALYTDTYLV